MAGLDPDLVIGSEEVAPLAEGIAPFCAIDFDAKRYADLAAREALRPAELPVGIVVTLLGGPVAIALLRRRPGRRA